MRRLPQLFIPGLIEEVDKLAAVNLQEDDNSVGKSLREDDNTTAIDLLEDDNSAAIDLQEDGAVAYDLTAAEPLLTSGTMLQYTAEYQGMCIILIVNLE